MQLDKKKTESLNKLNYQRSENWTQIELGDALTLDKCVCKCVYFGNWICEKISSFEIYIL